MQIKIKGTEIDFSIECYINDSMRGERDSNTFNFNYGSEYFPKNCSLEVEFLGNKDEGNIEYTITHKLIKDKVWRLATDEEFDSKEYFSRRIELNQDLTDIVLDENEDNFSLEQVKEMVETYNKALADEERCGYDGDFIYHRTTASGDDLECPNCHERI